MSKQVETKWAVLELTDTGILIFRYKEGVVLDEHVARAVVAVGVEMSGDLVPTPVLACLDQLKGFTRGARRFFAESDENYAASSHVALLVASPIARVIANFFLGLNKARVPTRSSTSHAKAMEWLEQQSRAARAKGAAPAGRAGEGAGTDRGAGEPPVG